MNKRQNRVFVEPQVALNQSQHQLQKITIKRNKEKSPLDDDTYEKRFTLIALAYLKSYLFFDVIACVPVLIYESTYRFATDEETVYNMIISGWYFLFCTFKLAKFS